MTALFAPTRGQDEAPDYTRNPDAVGSVIINAAAAARFGFSIPSEAIGKIIDSDHWNARIVGVIADMRFESPRQSVYPSVLFFNSLINSPYVGPIPAVRTSGVPVLEMEQRLNRAWSSVVPNVYGEFQTPNARMDSYFRGDEQRERIFTLGAVASIIIAAFGLYGQASFSASRRVHEVGIRKTLGASSAQITILLLIEFLRPVVIASGIACPLAWVIMQNWLSAFDERIPLGPTVFIIALSGALSIATLTVLGRTLRLAHAEPGRALRGE